MRAVTCRLAWLLIPLCLGPVACSGSDKPTSPDTDDDDPPVGSITITPAGGVFPLRGDRVELEVPAGLFAVETTLAVAALPDDAAEPGFFAGTGIDFGAAGVQLPGRVTLRIRFAPAELPAGMAGQSIDICRWGGGAWLPQGATAQLEGDQMVRTLQTSHLGQHALVATLPADAVCTGDYHQLVTTMAELEDFRGCRAIPLGLRIQGAAITSLDALSSVELIGDLELSGLTNLSSLAGLEALRSMGSFTLSYTPTDLDFGPLDGLLVCRSVSVYGCTGLTSLASEAAIADLGGLAVSGCPLLTSIDLPQIEMIGSMGLSNNVRLQAASFAAPTQVYRGFYVASDTALVALSGLAFDQALTEGYALENCTHLATLPAGGALTSIAGELKIERMPALTDLSFLAGLETIGDGAYIGHNSGLESLAGLEALSSIVGGLTLSANPALVTLGHLQSLAQIDGSLSVLDCDALPSMAGLGSVTVSEDLSINGNAALSSLAGLGGSVGRDLEIEMNPALTSLEGLAVNHVGRAVFIANNTGLTSLAGLAAVSGHTDLLIEGSPGLTSLAGIGSLIGLTSLEIAYNHGLTSLQGLGGLTEIITLTIDNNWNIANLNGLNNLHRVDGTLHIIGNALLLHAEGLESLLSVGSLQVQGNMNMQDLVGLEGLRRLGWTQQDSGGLSIRNQSHFPDLVPLYGLLPDPGTGKVIPGDCMLIGNHGMGDSGGWAFIEAIGGEVMVGGEIVIDNWR